MTISRDYWVELVMRPLVAATLFSFSLVACGGNCYAGEAFKVARDKHLRRDPVRIFASRLGQEDSPIHRCVFQYYNGDGDSVSVGDSWLSSDSDCNDAFGVYLPGNKLFSARRETAEGSDLIRARLTDRSGVELFNEKVISADDLGNAPFSIDEDPAVSEQGRVAFTIYQRDRINGERPSWIVVSDGTTYRLLKFQETPKVTFIGDWGEILLDYGGIDSPTGTTRSAIARVSDGSILRRFRKTLVAFNAKHETVTELQIYKGNLYKGGFLLQGRFGRRYLDSCSFPNSARLKDIKISSIDRLGRPHGYGVNIDDEERQTEFVLIPSPIGKVDGTNYCTSMTVTLSGSCENYLKWNPYEQVFEPESDSLTDSVPVPLICSARIHLRTASGKPLPGARVVVNDFDSPSLFSTKTDERGYALVQFTFTEEVYSVTIVSPFLDPSKRSSEIEVRRYHGRIT